MTDKAILSDDAYKDCARLLLMRELGTFTEQSLVAQCINKLFDGNAKKFCEWADDYIADGCGIRG